MFLSLGAQCPDFNAQSSLGAFNFKHWSGDGWTLVVGFKSMSPTCSTEFIELQRLQPAFAARRIKVLAVTGDAQTMLDEWLADLREFAGCEPWFALIADPGLQVAPLLGLTDPAAPAAALLRTALLLDPIGKVALSSTYPVTTGRNFEELLRASASVQLTYYKRVATGADWRDGDDVMLPPSMSQVDAEARYPGGVRVVRPYLRYIAQPED
jgi:alkyl hydroperoxide reductase subunit AhpC